MNQISNSKIPYDVLFVCEILHAHYCEAYVVGGAVRDLLLGIEPKDWDIATNAKPEFVMDLFEGAIPTGLQHGTVTIRPTTNIYVPGSGKHYVEVTTYRKDGDYTDGRRPDNVEFVTDIKHDLARRDFCINSMAYDPMSGNFLDPFHGQVDLEQKIISTVGKPNDRFKEDGLRCLRAIRFAAKLGFAIEKWTFSSIRPNIESFKKVSIERVTSELIKIFSNPGPTVSIALTRLMMSGIMDEIIPECQPMLDCEQNDWHAYDVMEHTLQVVAHCNNSDNDPALTLAAWFHDIGKPATRKWSEKRNNWQFLGHEEVSANMTHEIMTRMRFPNELRDKVCHLIRHHLVRYEPSWSNATVRRFVQRVGIDNVEQLLALYRADILGKGPAKLKQNVADVDELWQRVQGLNALAPIVSSTSDLAINGKDVMELLNIGPGPAVGSILKACLEAVTEDPSLNTKAALLSWICSGPKTS